jgi:CBS domain containing-hemolysin-like protein
LVVFAYLDRIYRELGRVTGGVLHQHLDIFEADIEPHFHLERRRAAPAFSMVAQLMVVAVAVVTAHAVLQSTPGSASALLPLFVYLLLEVLLFAQFIPYMLLARTQGRWLGPLVPFLRAALVITWPVRAALDLAISISRISDDEVSPRGESTQEGIEALVEVAQEEGILASDEAQLIEQVVEFSDKRVLEVMTPRPDIVAIPASATLEQLRRLLVETQFSRVLVYQDTLDEVQGIAQGHSLLQIPENETKRRTVREITTPVLFVPETKLGSELLKEMQRRNQHMAVAVDEHGLVAGIVTIEDLVEEIVGEMSKENASQSPDIIHEPDGSVVLRGSVSLSRVQALFGVEFTEEASESATTVAGLLNSISGHVPKAGESLDYDNLRFEVLEANQRKVLRLRVRPRTVTATTPAPR